MLRVDHKRWGQRPEDLRNLAVKAPHARSRERFLALYEITQGSNATRVATRIGRHPHNVMEWVHRYNAGGPDAISYRRTGGRVAAPSAAAQDLLSAYFAHFAGRFGPFRHLWRFHLCRFE